MAEPLAYLNGVYLPLSEAALPLTDGGFVNGAVVTDNCRTWNRKLFRWADHQARFRRDCKTCHIPLALSDCKLTAVAERLLDGDDGHVVTFATPQSLGMITRPIEHDRNRRFQQEGVVLRVVGHQPVAGDALLPPQPKHRSRMVWHMAQEQAGSAVAVLLDRPGGTLTETAIACVLAVIDGVLVSPPRTLILDSISLAVVLELAAAAGLVCEDREIREVDWLLAEEMLLTGTGCGLASVRQINAHTLPWNGPVFTTLWKAWENAVG